MSPTSQPNTPAERDRAKARLRFLTRGAIVAASGATVALGIVVAQDHPGASAGRNAADSTSSSSSTAVTNNSSSSGTSSGSSDSGTTGTTGNTGISSSSSSSSTPTASSSSPTVTSGATS